MMDAVSFLLDGASDAWRESFPPELLRTGRAAGLEYASHSAVVDLDPDVSEEQRIRNRYLRDHLPMRENEWPGFTLVTHILKAVGSDSAAIQALEPAFTGQRVSVFYPDGRERLNLEIEHLRIFIADAAISIDFVPEPGTTIMEPPHVLRAEEIPGQPVYSFQVPTERQS